jgi:YHS domain-containing protein
MVRDRICNTFLPEARALVTHRDGEAHFFCSPDCQAAFQSTTEQA